MRTVGAAVVVVDRHGATLEGDASLLGPKMPVPEAHLVAAERGENPVFKTETSRGERWVSLVSAGAGRFRVTIILDPRAELFESAFNTQFQFIAILDLEGRVLDINDLPVDVQGIPRGVFLSDFFWEAPTWTNLPGWPERIRSQVMQAIRTGETVMTEDLFQTADGQTRVALAAYSTVKNVDGTPRFAIVQATDITGLKQTEERLLASKVRLERRNRELTELHWIASHDLHEPLRTMRSFVDLLAVKYAGTLDEEGEECIRYISRANQRLDDLVRDLVDHARIGNDDDVVPVDTAEIVANVLAGLQTHVEASGADVVVGPLPIVYARPAELSMLFQNLLSNALKYHRRGTPPKVRVAATAEGEHWVFRVQDDGIGIEARDAERVFGVFKRLHSREAYVGTGIGLAHCRKIVELHGGRIWVDPNVPHGSIFGFTLPRSEPRDQAEVHPAGR